MNNFKETLKNILKDFHWHNFNWQVFNYGISGVLLIIFYVVLARFWSLEEFGKFNTIMVWMAVYSLTADLGLDFWVTKSTSLDKQKAYPINLIRFRIVSTALISILFVLFAYFQALPLIEFSIFIIGTFILNITHFFSCYLRGNEKLSIEAKITGLRMFIFIGTGLIAVVAGLKLKSVAICYLTSTIIMALIIERELKKLNFQIFPRHTPITGLLKKTTSIWLGALLLGMTIKLETLILGALTSQEKVAIFGAASRFFEGGQLLVTAFILTTFPKLAQCHKHKKKEYATFAKGNLKLLVALVLVASLCGISFGKLFLVSLFGDSYQASLDVFIVLMLTLPLTAASCFLYQVLVIANKTLPVILVLFSGLCISSLFNYFLIPVFQIDGMLISIVLKEFFVLISLWLITLRLGQSIANESSQKVSNMHV